MEYQQLLQPMLQYGPLGLVIVAIVIMFAMLVERGFEFKVPPRE